jgi:hypothetical protein
MSQEEISRKVRRTCEGCGKAVEYEFIGATDAALVEMMSWYTIVRQFLINGRPEKLMVQACSITCVPAAALKLEAVPSGLDEPADQIDLSTLQVNPDPTVN